MIGCGAPIHRFAQNDVVEAIPFSLRMHVHFSHELRLIAGPAQFGGQCGGRMPFESILVVAESVGLGRLPGEQAAPGRDAKGGR